MVRTVLTSILKEGRAVRAWFGASGKTVTAELAKNLALPRPMGVVVDRVLPHSPAADAGLAVGDIVRTVNGREVHDAEELRYMIASLPVSGRGHPRDPPQTARSAPCRCRWRRRRTCRPARKPC